MKFKTLAQTDIEKELERLRKQHETISMASEAYIECWKKLEELEKLYKVMYKE